MYNPRRHEIVYQQVNEEKLQGHSTRVHLYEQLEKDFEGVPIVAFFTSFRYPVMLSDEDAIMLEGILRKTDLKNGMILLLNSPGGSGLAAERIIKICRCYSGTNEYSVVVPGKAKSAATMVCLGAQKILMSHTSELGPIDPQIVYRGEQGEDRFSAYNIIKSYKELFDRATKTKGRIEPFLQQLSLYDAREIEEMKKELELSSDIAVKALKLGIFRKLRRTEIEKRIKLFLVPEKVKTHGRPISFEEAKEAGLNVELADSKSEKWDRVYELYVRLDRLVASNNTAKCIETKDHSFLARYAGE
jgi:ClpP class serine protease